MLEVLSIAGKSLQTQGHVTTPARTFPGEFDPTDRCVILMRRFIVKKLDRVFHWFLNVIVIFIFSICNFWSNVKLKMIPDQNYLIIWNDYVYICLFFHNSSFICFIMCERMSQPVGYYTHRPQGGRQHMLTHTQADGLFWFACPTFNKAYSLKSRAAVSGVPTCLLVSKVLGLLQHLTLMICWCFVGVLSTACYHM